MARSFNAAAGDKLQPTDGGAAYNVSNWTVHGWVVECSIQESDYQVTLLFSDLPKGLQQVLALASGEKSRAYPEVVGAEIFGLN